MMAASRRLGRGSVEKAVHLWLHTGVFTFTEGSSVTRQWYLGNPG